MDKIKELEYWRDKIHEIGIREGLDFYDMIYDIVPGDVMYTFGSYGMPNRFNHWRFGKRFDRMQHMRKMGMMKIYELVINTNPCYAFLLEENTLLENKLIISHVLGHSDFFKNNRKFKHTDSNYVLDEMRIHSEKIRKYEEMYGVDEVERVLDLGMTIEEQTQLMKEVQKSPALADWQRHILRMLAVEMDYFFPQMETKIINEGWATFWHVKIMNEIIEDESEAVAFAKMHAGVLRPNPQGVNPYLLGYKIFQSIEKEYGMEKVFEVRELDSDMTFVRNYFTQEIAEDLNMYVYKSKNREQNEVTHTSFEQIKENLIASMVNHGYPILHAEHGEKEFMIRHDFDGRKINRNQLEHVLKTVHPFLSQKTIEFYTANDKKKVKYVYNGKEFSAVELNAPAESPN